MWKNPWSAPLTNEELDYVHTMHQYLKTVIVCSVCKTRPDRTTPERTHQVFRDCPRCTLMNRIRNKHPG